MLRPSKEVKLMLQTPGLAVFDPVVLGEFVRQNTISQPDILQYFIDNPEVGHQALVIGSVLPIYSIEHWNYRIYITESGTSTLPEGWELFETPTFVLRVVSGWVVVSDIWALLHWDESEYEQRDQQPVDQRYTDMEFKIDDQVAVENGLYEVKVIGFSNPDAPDSLRRECGYELLFTRNESAQSKIADCFQQINFDVLGLPDTEAS